MKILHFGWTTLENKITFWKKWPSRLRVKWTNDDLLSIGTIRNKLHWNLNKNTTIFIEESESENFVCKMGRDIVPALMC